MTKHSLFLDTSSFIQVGLLNEKSEWVSYELIKNKKGSQVLHGLIFDILRENGITIKDIGRLIVANGPGSYTGIRLAEGFAQILEIEKIEILNFYHFEIPYFLGRESYKYVASAFKNEFFCFQLSEGKEKQSLISNAEFMNLKDDEEIYHIGDDVNGRSFKSVYPLFEKESVQIFDSVIKRSSRNEPFYFRPLEKEFKTSNLTT